MYKKIRSHPTTLHIYSSKISSQGLFSESQIEKKKLDFKKFLETQFNDQKIINLNLSGLMEFGHDLSQVWEKIKEE